MNNGKIQKTIKTIILHAESVAVALGFIMSVMCLIFLYNNFWRGVSDASVLAEIKGQVAIKVIDMQLWEQIKEGDALKKQELGLGEIKHNPF
jgi:hypothetical protein